MATILIAEDSGPLRNLLSSVLSSLGHDVLEACDAQRALELGTQSKSPVDLLCAHMAMDRTDGAWLAEHLRERHAAMKVLLLVTENPNYVIVDTPGICKDNPCYGVLRKPFTIEQLVGKVQEMLKPSAVH